MWGFFLSVLNITNRGLRGKIGISRLFFNLAQVQNNLGILFYNFFAATSTSLKKKNRVLHDGISDQ